MKKRIWIPMVLIFAIPLWIYALTTARVYAVMGVEGLEFYTITLESIIAVAQYGMEYVADIVQTTIGSIVSLFGIIWG